MILKRKKMAAEASNASVQKSFWTSRQATLIAGALILLAVLAAYCNTFSVPFTFDDKPAIIGNASIRHLWPIQRALSPPPGGITVGGRPVLNFSLALNYALSGTNVWSYHALNLAIHILASLTLLGIVRRTLLAPLWKNRFERSALPLALAVALLWALHPLQTEAVTYVIQRAESLMGLFYLLTLYCFIRAAPLISNFKFQISNTAGHRPISNLKFQISNTAGHRPISNFKFQISNLWFVLCIAACLLGMGTKEVMLSAPVMVLLYDRTFVAGSFRRALRQRWGLYAGLAAGWLLLALDFGGQNSNLNATISPWSYALTQCWAIVHYLLLSFWPSPLIFDYGRFLVSDPWQAVPCALITGSLATATLVALRWRPALAFLGFWFFAILAPTSSLLPLGGQTVAEHRMYLPLAAVIALAVLGIHFFLAGDWRLGSADRDQNRAASGFKKVGAFSPQIETALIIAAAFAMAQLTFRRNYVYRSELALWSDTAAKCLDNDRAQYNQYNYGLALPRHGELQEAMGRFRAAIDLRPDNDRAQYNYGLALVQHGELEEAIGRFRAAIELNPDSCPAHNDLGAACLQMGRLEEAIVEFRRVLKLNPDFVEARNNLGTALQRAGQPAAAVAEFQKALAVEPDDPDTHNNLGSALRDLGRQDEAMSHFQRALALRPDDANAHNNLGNVLLAKGRTAEAVASFRKALDAQPQNLAPLNNLAWTLATSADASIRNGAEAVELAQRASGLAGGSNPIVLRTLAAAYAEAGSFAEAVAAAQRALDVAAAQSNSVVADSARAQLRLYQAGLPFRDAASTNAAAGKKN